MRALATVVLTGVLLGLGCGTPASAYYLDGARNFDLRARGYTEGVLSAIHSEPQTKPARGPLQLISHRTFFNPEFDGNLKPWAPFGMDDLSFHFALWGFYDGIYEYGTGQFDRARNNLKALFLEGHSKTGAVTGSARAVDTTKLYTYQPDPVLSGDTDNGEVARVPFRFNEAYFNLKKGPAFFRVGRQTVSWGESDTVALLDQSNPFNVAQGPPGIFEDIDEARIPLWTFRTNWSLFEKWGPLSTAFVDAYLVPGSIDSTVPVTPIVEASPFSAPETDPQGFIDAFTAFIPEDVRSVLIKGALGGIRFVQYDHLPSRSMRNSRYGVRLGALIAREYTSSIWYYRTIAQNPVPRFLPLDLSRVPSLTPGEGGDKGPAQLITELVHGTVDVVGGGTSWFSEMLDGIVRGEVEFFINEPGFIPDKNINFADLTRQPRLRQYLGTLGINIPNGPDQGTVPHNDIMRWELGYDRFFFFRPLNPSNSFTWVTALVGQWNLTETFTGQDFRFYGQRKPSDTGLKVGANVNDLNGIQDVGKLHTVPTDFVDLHPVEGFIQTTLQTDYWHGRLTPRITAIVGKNGSLAFPMSLLYRYTDNLLFELRYLKFGGTFTFPTGFYRDRDEIVLRMTMQLN
jgi:Protein of unknown function (DUF1302)